MVTGEINLGRRQFGAIVLAVGSAGCIDDVAETVGASGTSGMEQDFGFGSAGFDRLEWSEDGQVTLWFDEDHEMDGFGISHTYHDPLNDSIVSGQAPDFDGPVEFPLLDYIRGADLEYPNNEFVLGAFKGTFTDIEFSFGFAEERLGDQEFTVPEDLMPEEDAESREDAEGDGEAIVMSHSANI